MPIRTTFTISLAGDDTRRGRDRLCGKEMTLVCLGLPAPVLTGALCPTLCSAGLPRAGAEVTGRVRRPKHRLRLYVRAQRLTAGWGVSKFVLIFFYSFQFGLYNYRALMTNLLPTLGIS